MTFGLSDAAAAYQLLIAQAQTRVTKKCSNLVMCSVDVVAIVTSTFSDDIERLDKVLACMKSGGLKYRPTKCEILKNSTWK